MATRKSRLFSQMFSLSILVHLVFCKSVHSSNSEVNAESNTGSCVEVERQALLKFKQEIYTKTVNLTHGVDLLPSWGSAEEKRDCCNWLGVTCANKSGHVISLIFSTSSEYYSLFLEGNYTSDLMIDLSPSLVDLRFLEYLDLSVIPWSGIPSFIGNFSQLRYLFLGNCYISGEIPPQVGNLSRLQVLDLSLNDWRTKNFDWVFRLSSLRKLDLSFTNLSEANNWIEIFNKLPRLASLDLRGCGLPNVIPSYLSLVNSSSSLDFLDLSWNQYLNFPIHKWSLFNFSRSLSHLDLCYNQLEGSIPEAIGNMTTLKYLDLSHNKLGVFPKSFWNFCSRSLSAVGGNNFGGHFAEYNQSFSWCKNFSLHYLDASNNPLEGVISEANLSKLPKLAYLDLSYSSLNLVINSNWIPPFQLDSIRLRSCKLGPLFPKWLQTQKQYSELDISNSGIADSIPDWFWGSISKKCNEINLSNNQIHGKITNSSFVSTYIPPVVDLGMNQLEGSIPQFLFRAGALNLSMNKLSEMESLCDVDNSTLSFLDISSNQLSGELPNCWSHFKELRSLVLEDNMLSGKLPASIGSLTQMSSLHLRNNNLVGLLPSSFKNCKQLTVLDVGENNLSGPIPTWIGKSLADLIILVLRSNSFYGSVPFHLCHLAHLQVLDLSRNNLSEDIPKCVGNFSAMEDQRSTQGLGISQNYEWSSEDETLTGTFDDEVQLQWKGKSSSYSSTLGLVKSVDLSSNNLVGGIPIEITNLVGLISLNLSRNKLSGQIPLEIGKMEMLDVLDLSNNQLSGKIPTSLSEVHRLNMLDLSNNRLSGKIPTGTQLQSFDAATFTGNPELCGDPLRKKCPGEEPSLVNGERKINQDVFLTRGFYMSMGLGFVIGFWGACGTLIFIKSWRYAYFKFWDGVKDRVFLMATLRKAKIMRIIKS